jgi:hypothetical protein
VFDDGRAWKCHTGCGEGSVIDFFVKAKGISEEEACKEILRRAGAQDALPHFANRRVTVIAHPDEAGREAAARWAKQIQGAEGLFRILQLKKHDLCDIVAAGATHNDLRSLLV